MITTEFLQNSVFYPACLFDGAPVKFFNEHYSEYGINNFVYVDYAVNGNQLRISEDTFRYYHILSSKELFQKDLEVPGTDYRQFSSILTQEEKSKLKEVVYQMFGGTISPFARFLVYERNAGVGEERGPQQFSLLYIGGEAVATYAALYSCRKIAPKVISIICPGTGWGGNYTDFFSKDGALLRLASTGEQKPQFIYFGGNRTIPFAEYKELEYPKG